MRPSVSVTTTTDFSHWARFRYKVDMETPWAFGVYLSTHSTAPGVRRLTGKKSAMSSANARVSSVWPGGVFSGLRTTRSNRHWGSACSPCSWAASRRLRRPCPGAEDEEDEGGPEKKDCQELRKKDPAAAAANAAASAAASAASAADGGAAGTCRLTATPRLTGAAAPSAPCDADAQLVGRAAASSSAMQSEQAKGTQVLVIASVDECCFAESMASNKTCAAS
mmetsp:Transcript_6141/g.16871  ORF Transcript_6141/g.16871 Transcript_6141/m.16871 type:complete len:223 (+) Transcript_6141:412-1080(+)